MARTGIAAIDQLVEGQNAAPIGSGHPDREAVGILQDLLIGHGFKELPGILGTSRGVFGQKTAAAVRAFQQRQRLPESGTVDRSTLQGLIEVPAENPIASRGYLTLVLDLLFTGMVRLASLTSQFEGAGRFAVLNLNTDRAGLSFGLIQWAQKPGRLNEILRAFQSAQLQPFVQIFGDGDQALATGLITHTSKSNGGVNDNGQTTDAKFDLIKEPWVSRFRAAGRDPALQRAQIDTALTDFRTSLQRLQAFAPQIRSERGVAFMLDLANQHGDGGAKSIFTKVQRPGMSEAELLTAVENESVARVREQFKNHANGESIVASTQSRREAFRTSPLLSDAVFNPAD
jgi:peptidoglycan hydrolase-like protein with peptidoglycan-binding domain